MKIVPSQNKFRRAHDNNMYTIHIRAIINIIDLSTHSAKRMFIDVHNNEDIPDISFIISVQFDG